MTISKSDSNKAYYLRNKAKVLARQKAYYTANKEKALASQKAWREKNKEKIIARSAKYYQEVRKIKNNEKD